MHENVMGHKFCLVMVKPNPTYGRHGHDLGWCGRLW